MKISRVLAVLLRQYYLTRGSLPRLFPIFMWVGMDVLLWGFMTRYLDSRMPGAHWTTSLLGAVLLWDFTCRVMFGISTTFLEDVWSRNFLSIFASPLSIPEYLGGLILTTVITSALGLLIMLLLANQIFGLSFWNYGALLFPYFAILFAFGVALGIFICAVVFRVGPAGEWFVWPLPILLSPFASVFYPIQVLPIWMQWIAHLLPPAYVFESMRALAAHKTSSMPPLGGGLTLAVVYVVAACAYFVQVFRQAVRSGLIARYSAESVA